MVYPKLAAKNGFFKYKMRIYDCFTFFNELDLLEVRLEELYDTVDKFVIVEANVTHTGKRKDYLLEKNKKRYKKWWDKICYIKVDNMPRIRFNWLYLFLSTRKSSVLRSLSYDLKIGPWRLENFQRNQIALGLMDAHDEDLIIVGDLDEIPSTNGINQSKKFLNKYERVTFKMKHFKFYYNNFYDDEWKGTKIIKMKTLRNKLYNKPQLVRTSFSEKFFTKILRINFLKSKFIKEGWHFSWVGNCQAIKQKQSSTSHQEKKAFLIENKKIIKINKTYFPRSLFERRYQSNYKKSIANVK